MKKKELSIKETLILAVQNCQKNNFEKAEELCNKILNIDPDHFDTIFLLGSLSVQTKNFDIAEKFLNKAIQIQPNNINAHLNLAILFKELRNFEKSISCYQKAIKIQPNHARSHNDLGVAFKELREFQKSKNCFQKAIEIDSNYVPAYINLGNILKELGDYKKAIINYQKAIQIQPNNLKPYLNLGILFEDQGEIGKAIEYYEKIVHYETGNLRIHFALNNLKNENINSDLKNNIEKIIKEKKSTKANLAYGHLLLSKYEYSLKNYEKEFNHLLRGHELFFSSLNSKDKKSVDYWLNELPKIKELININKNLKKSNYKIKPIFIIGVPRCGSTLVEKIITSCPKFIPMGEETGVFSMLMWDQIRNKKNLISNMENFKIDLIEKYKEKELIQKKSDYIFTDKSLENFFYLGLIKKIFPEAKVINCKRNATSSIMSIFKRNLGDIIWAHNLDNIFKYFDIYNHLTKKFKKLFPDFIYELHYEQLVNEPEIESKKLLNFCNLPWDISCLEFYKRKDLVSRTASKHQIRKAIYKDSLNVHPAYKALLKKYGDKYSWYN